MLAAVIVISSSVTVSFISVELLTIPQCCVHTVLFISFISMKLLTSFKSFPKRSIYHVFSNIFLLFDNVQQYLLQFYFYTIKNITMLIIGDV